MMLLLEPSDSDWMTQPDIQDSKQLLSFFWVNWSIYLYHMCIYFKIFLASAGAPYVVMYHWYWSSHFFHSAHQDFEHFCQYIQILGHLIHCNFIQYHACCRTSFFGRVNKALEIFHYPTRGYSTTRLLSSLPYPTLPETEKPLPVRACTPDHFIVHVEHV